jgi:uncharacterized repeat protein (TIGR01451 family)
MSVPTFFREKIGSLRTSPFNSVATNSLSLSYCNSVASYFRDLAWDSSTLKKGNNAMRHSVTSTIQEKSGLMFPSNLVLTARTSWIISIAALLLIVSGLTQAALAQARSNSLPMARVQSRVDNTQRAILTGHTLPILRNAPDLGRVRGETAMNRLIMVLRASPEQEHALRTLLDQQLDKKHANFHQWMTPEQFGAHFGVADSDIALVTNWLRQQGFAVENVAPGKRFIQFSGSVKQVESAFQTEMHSYMVQGETHIANSRDISVPAALKPVISGVPTLHDFFKKADVQDLGTLMGKIYEWDPFTGTMPDYTNGTTHFVGAADFAAIYNTNPLLTTGFDGTGVTIGIIGRTDINLGDVQVYREFFGLKDNDPTFTIAGEDPGIVGGDDTESYLDVEVSGGAAPGAKVNFITSRATLTTDGVDLSAMYAVQNNLTDIISESYGQCEANFTSAQAAFYNSLWGQAAAQGQSVFVSSGDNGPAACDNSNSTFSSFGYAVSLLASSPFNVAVGGTLFADTTGGPWWGTTATTSEPFESALGYIPEIPWNEAKASGAVGAAGLWSGSGGISTYFMTPSWQRGFGVPAADPPYPNLPTFVDPPTPFVTGPHRYLPDVAMAAAAQHDGTLYCAEGICQLSSTGSIVNAGIVGGTSVAAPTMAGVQALVDQVNGGRQGLPNYVYYALADAQHTGGLNCSPEAGGAMSPNCAFHDVDTGNTLVCTNSACTAANKIGWTAAAGYDMASGLGSPNAANLANLWNTITFNSSVTSLNVAQTTGITHGRSVNVSGAVAPGAGGGTPSGNVAFIVSSGALTDPIDPNTGGFANQVALATLDGSGNYNVNLTDLPAGTYTLTARYGGDTTFASSLSPAVAVTVTSEGSTLTIEPNLFNGTTCAETTQTTFTYGSYIWTDFVVQGASGQGVATGTVAVTDNGNPLTTAALNANGIGHMLSGAIPSSSCVFGYTFQDVAPPIVGTHTLGATYSGDSNFSPMTASPVVITITPATITGALAPASLFISSGGSVQLNFTLAGIPGAGPGTLAPTGTVTFTDTTTATTLGMATLSPTSNSGGVAFITTTGITASGPHSIQASWPGDGNYNSVNSSLVTVTVQTGTATSVVVTSNANPSTVGGRPTFTATMTPTTVTSGAMSFYDSGVLLGTGTVGATHTATFRPGATVNLPAGTHNITAIYGGNATYDSSTSAVFHQGFNQTATTIQLTAKNQGHYGDFFDMSAVLGLGGTVVPSPSGIITFYDGATPIGTAPLTVVTAAQGGLGIWQSQLELKLSLGVHTLTAQLTDPNYTAATSNTQTVTVVAPPTISKAFGVASIPLNGQTSLTFTIQNPNTTTTLTGIGFTDTLPAGLVISTPTGVSASCATGTYSYPEGSRTISVSGLSLAAGSSCFFTVTNVTGTAGGNQNNTTSAVTSNEGGTGATSNTATVNVVAPPTIAKAFFATNIPLNGSTFLNFTIINPAANTVAETGVAFTDTLPAGLTVANSSTSTCGGTVTTTAATGVISLSGAVIAATGNCLFSVSVTGTTTGVKNNTTGTVSSTNGGTGNIATANITVALPPTISKAFGAASIPLNSTTSLTFTIANPNSNVAFTGVAFTDTLPAGLTVATGTSTTCGGGTLTATSPSTISLSGGTIAASGNCSFSVTVTGATAGVLNNTTGAVSSNEGGTGTTSNTATITVVAPPTIGKVFGASSIPLNGTTLLGFTIQNLNSTTTLTGIGFSDTLPSGLVISTPNGLSGSCGAGTITATAGGSTISLSGATLAAGGSCNFSVNVTGTTAGGKTNTTGNITSVQGGTGGAATASIAVVAPPTISKAFGAPTILLAGSTTLTFTLTNPSANSVAEAGVAFTDTLPTGLVVATPNGLTDTCGGTVTATAGASSISLAGGTISINTNCTLVVNVTGTSTGVKNNTTGAVSSTNGGTGATSNTATLTVNQPPHVTSLNYATFAKGVQGTFTVTTTGYPVPSLTTSPAGSLPAGVTFVDNHNGTATISGKPTVSGTFSFWITASNGVSPQGLQSFTLTVQPH